MKLGDAPIYAYVPISDIERGRSFYEDVLELKPQMEIPGVGVSYQCGDNTAFFMYLSEGAGTSEASVAYWMVDDVESVVADLRGRGVVFEEYDLPGMKTEDGIARGDGSKAAWFKDPDGNILAIIATGR